jgi:hypothetical protein
MRFIQWLPSRAASSTCAGTSGQCGPTGAGYDVVMTEQERDLTEKADTGLGGFEEAGTIEPDVADKADREPDVPRAPADPTDEPAPRGPLNPA